MDVKRKWDRCFKSKGKNKIIRKCWMKSGSYTVEASFIIPLLLGIFFLLLFTVFFLHDKAALQGNLQDVVYLTVQQRLSAEEEDYTVYLRQSLWAMELTETKLSENSTAVSGFVRAKMTWNIPVLSTFMPQMQEVELSLSVSKVQPEEVLYIGR